MQKNTISHFEIYANDPDKLAKFYTDMFDWKITAVPAWTTGWCTPARPMIRGC